MAGGFSFSGKHEREPKAVEGTRIERLKREKNAWERLDEIREFARKGFGSIPPEWLGTTSARGASIPRAMARAPSAAKGGQGKADSLSSWFVSESPTGYSRAIRSAPLPMSSSDMPGDLRTSLSGKMSSCTGSRIEDLPDVLEQLS